MNKAKSKPKNAAAEPSRPATAGSRARDLEEDIFDVAHNTMLRSKVSAATSIAAAAVLATATLTATRAATAHTVASLAASAFPINPNPNPNPDTEQVVDHHSGHTSSRAALREEWDGGFGERSIVPTPESMDKEAKTETEREEVRKAVDATWASMSKCRLGGATACRPGRPGRTA